MYAIDESLLYDTFSRVKALTLFYSNLQFHQGSASPILLANREVNRRRRVALIDETPKTLMESLLGNRRKLNGADNHKSVARNLQADTDGLSVNFLRCTFEGNVVSLPGTSGALYGIITGMEPSNRITIRNSVFLSNSLDIPNVTVSFDFCSSLCGWFIIVARLSHSIATFLHVFDPSSTILSVLLAASRLRSGGKRYSPNDEQCISG